MKVDREVAFVSCRAMSANDLALACVGAGWSQSEAVTATRWGGTMSDPPHCTVCVYDQAMAVMAITVRAMLRGGRGWRGWGRGFAAHDVLHARV